MCVPDNIQDQHFTHLHLEEVPLPAGKVVGDMGVKRQEPVQPVIMHIQPSLFQAHEPLVQREMDALHRWWAFNRRDRCPLLGRNLECYTRPNSSASGEQYAFSFKHPIGAPGVDISSNNHRSYVCIYIYIYLSLSLSVSLSLYLYIRSNTFYHITEGLVIRSPRTAMEPCLMFGPLQSKQTQTQSCSYAM